MRHVLFMDEDERAQGGISGEHQVPVRMPLGAAALSQGGWEGWAPWPPPPPPPPGHPAELPMDTCRGAWAETASHELSHDFQSPGCRTEFSRPRMAPRRAPALPLAHTHFTEHL